MYSRLQRIYLMWYLEATDGLNREEKDQLNALMRAEVAEGDLTLDDLRKMARDHAARRLEAEHEQK